MNGAEWYTGSRQPKKIGGPGCFQDCGSKKICMPKKQKTGYSRKKDSRKDSRNQRKICLLFFLKSKSGRNQPGKCRLDSGIRKSSHKSLQRKDQLIQTKTFRTNGMG